MLPKANRLSDRRDIHRVFRSGRKAYGSLFSFSYVPNTDQQSRLAVIVGKKAFPRAVDRNRLKRLARESIHSFLPALTTGFDGAFSALKTPLKKPTLADVSADIESILRKTSLLKHG
jgi:ribonuclease P protein component